MSAEQTATARAIRRSLGRLRGKLRAYVAVQGVFLLLLVVGGLFWASVAIDYPLEVPWEVRLGILILGGAGLVFALVRWLLAPLARRVRARDLALVLERRYPEYGDRLVTSVELGERAEGEAERADRPVTLPSSPKGERMRAGESLGAVMLARVEEEAAELSAKLPQRPVFRAVPLARAVGLGALAVASVAGFCVLAEAIGFPLDVWFRRNVLLADDLYPRRTHLHVFAVDHEGREVELTAERPWLAARGADVEIVIRAETGAERVVPERVRVRYEAVEGGGRGDVQLARTGTQGSGVSGQGSGEGGSTVGRHDHSLQPLAPGAQPVWLDEGRFRHTFRGVLGLLEFDVTGGDAYLGGFTIEVREGPRVAGLELDCRYPEYMERAAAVVRVEGAQVSVPAGTEVALAAETNKPLAAVELEVEGGALRQAEAEEWSPGLTGARPPPAPPLQGGEREVALHGGEGEVASRGGEQAVDGSAGRQGIDHIDYRLERPAARFRIPLGVIPASGGASAPLRLRITLVDADGLRSTSPIELQIDGTPDQAPRVDTRLSGVSRAITRMALVPLVGSISDDYGSAEARYEFRIDAEEEWRRAPLGGAGQAAGGTPAPLPLFAPGAPEVPLNVRFEVLPLELRPGQNLRLRVVAEDTDTLAGPNVGQSDEYVFDIVTPDELLAMIAERESNLRIRFEQVISEVEATRDSVAELGVRLQEGAAGEAPSDAPERGGNLGVPLDEGLLGIRKNANETASIAQALRDILAEVRNNRIATPEMESRLEHRLIEPLGQIVGEDFPAAEESLEVAREALDGPSRPVAAVQTATATLDVLLANMRAVRDEMRELEDFNETVALLREIIEMQEEVRAETESQRRREILERLR